MKCTSASALILASFATSAYAAPGFLVERNIPSIPSTPNTPSSVSFSSFLPHDERDGAPRPSELDHPVLKSRQLPAAGEDEEDIRSPSEDGRPQNSPAAVNGGLAVPKRHRKSSSTVRSRPKTGEGSEPLNSYHNRDKDRPTERVDDATTKKRQKNKSSSSRNDPPNLDGSSTSSKPQTPGCSRCGQHRHFHRHDRSTWTLSQKYATEETLPTTKAGEDSSKSGRDSIQRKKPRSKSSVSSSASSLDVFNSQQAGSLMFNQHLNPPSTTTVGTNAASGNTNGPTTSTSGSGDISTGSATVMNAPFWN
ncbi:hypothetical protein EV361DRAFT_885841 [Lentinula raphanica]|nr:hypothetical protein EV361DRAFT_885841 [Lentinula raphanica]